MVGRVAPILAVGDALRSCVSGARADTLADRRLRLGRLPPTGLTRLTDEDRAEFLAEVRSPRLGAPEHIAAIVASLLSDDDAYINGQTITLPVDAGAFAK